MAEIKIDTSSTPPPFPPLPPPPPLYDEAVIVFHDSQCWSHPVYTPNFGEEGSLRSVSHQRCAAFSGILPLRSLVEGRYVARELIQKWGTRDSQKWRELRRGSGKHRIQHERGTRGNC